MGNDERAEPGSAARPEATAPPVVRVVPEEIGRTPVQHTMKLARRHGPLFVREVPHLSSLFAGSLDLVTELSDEERFTKSVGPALQFVRRFAGDGLFTAFNDEPNWAKAHDILLPAFALSSIRRYHPTMVTVARRLLATWDAAACAAAPVDVSESMTRMTLDTIGLAGFGYDFGSFERSDPHPFVAAMTRALSYSQAFFTRDPGTAPPTDEERDLEAAFDADARFMADVVDEVISARRSAGDTTTGDLLGLMLQSPHPRTGEVLDPENIRNQVITFLIAGHETTSGTLAFALHYLVKHPDVLRRAQAEVDALWGAVPDPDPSYEDVGRLVYVRQVLNEALRLWPTAAAFGREARHDTVLGGVPLKAGQSALVLTPMLHRDPVWGDNVEAFDPDRFTPEAVAARPGHAFKPFGTGERACIGRQFAMHEAVMLLGLLVHRYRLLDHAGYQLRIRETLTLKPEGFTLVPAARTERRPALVAAPTRDGVPRTASGPTRVVRGSRLSVLYGSNLGTCRDLAHAVADLGDALGFTTACGPLDSCPPEDLPAGSPVVIVASSYNGRPTDDATGFVTELEAPGVKLPAGVRHAVLGVGDRNWAATYQRVPTLIDDLMAAAGGHRLLTRGEADAGGDLSAAVEPFTRRLREVLLAVYGDPDSFGAPPVGTAEHAGGYEVSELVGGPRHLLAERHSMTAMTVAVSRTLLDRDHPKGRLKQFVRLELPSGTTYRTGDHLAVLPEQSPALVDRAALLLGLDVTARVLIRAQRPGSAALPLDRPITVGDLLAHHLELQSPATARDISILARLNPCPPERAALEQLEPGRRSVLDLIEAHPALMGTLDWQAVLSLLRPIRARHYSVSSSAEESPGHVDLMVSLLRTEGVIGTASGFLTRTANGDTVLARVVPCRESARVRTDTPVIMVAAGTGLAPFRGAVADRRLMLERGGELPPALCYFGCDLPDVDYLHAAELREAEKLGAVSMRPAFALAPENGWGFVQQRMTAEGDEVWRLLGDGGSVYVCGDANRLAPGVREALHQIHRHQTGATHAAAVDWLEELTAGGRYVEDVFASG
ncbi:cytochrome P450 [Streptomyces sp. NPDC057910]|uniref:cytochrome P450 n=1 Tax=Streptomyces sp. NPDC057910 TaxID=3346278 RepID=UPI0036E103EE